MNTSIHPAAVDGHRTRRPALAEAGLPAYTAEDRARDEERRVEAQVRAWEDRWA